MDREEMLESAGDLGQSLDGSLVLVQVLIEQRVAYVAATEVCGEVLEGTCGVCLSHFLLHSILHYWVDWGRTVA